MGPSFRGRRLTPRQVVLAAIAVTALILAALVGVVSSRGHQHVALEEWVANNARVALVDSQLIATRLADARSTLDALAHLPVFRHLTWRQMIDPALNGIPHNLDRRKRELLQAFLGQNGFRAFFILTPEGGHYLSYPFSTQRSLRRSNLSERDYIQKALRTGTPTVSDALVGADGQTAVAMATPLRDGDGTLIGILGGVLFLDDLQALVASAVLGPNRVGILVDGKGRILARTDTPLPPDRLLNVADDPLFGVLARGGANRVTTVETDNGPFAVADFPQAPRWRLMVASPADAVAGRLQQRARRHGLVLAGLVVLVGALGLVALLLMTRFWDQARQALDVSEERYRALFDLSPVAVVVYRDFRVTLANDAAARLFGVDSPQALHDREILSMVAPEDQDHARLRVTNAAAGTPQPPARHTVITAEGRHVPVEATGHPVHTPAGVDVMVVVHDMTEHQRLLDLEHRAARHQQAERDRLSAVLEHLDALVHVSNLDTGKVLFLNERARQVYGHHLDEACWLQPGPPNARHCDACGLRATDPRTGLENGPLTWECHKGQTGRWYECQAQVIGWPDGRQVRLEMAHDITERREAEERQRQLVEILEAAPDLIGMIDGEGHVLYLSAGGRTLLGLPPSVPGGLGFDVPELPDLFSAPDKVLHPAWAWDLIRDEGLPTARDQGLWRGNSALCTVGGEEIPASQTIVAHYHADGTVARYSTIVRDMRERTQLENTLREREAFFRELIEAQTELVGRFLPDTTLLYVNPAHAQFMGLSPEALVGLRWRDIIQPEEAAPLAARMAELTPETPHFAAEVMVPREHGDTRLVHWKIRAFFDQERQLSHLQGVGQDITEQRAAEQALQRSNDDLERFAYAVSHDLQEPLRMVANYTALLERRYSAQLDDRARDFILHAVDGAQRMARMIQDLLSYSRVTTQSQPVAEVSLAAVAGEALENLATRVGETGAEVTLGRLPRVLGDRPQLLRLFQNLLSNALKYRHPDRRCVITVDALPRGDTWWELRVEDNGIGIKPEDRQRVFDVFQRLARDQEGTGVGLALVKRIVERHGGAVWVTGNDQGGSTFHVTLPGLGDPL